MGSLPTVLLVVRALTGQDIRAIGSGNIGTVNVYRVAGLPAAVLVLGVDMLKGAAPVLLARRWGQTAEIQVAGGLAAVAGRNRSVSLWLSWGKGNGTTFGERLAITTTVG